MGTLLYHIVWFTNGLWNFVVADAVCSGHLIEMTTEEMINKFHDIMLEDCYVKEFEIAKKINISSECVFSILHESM